MFERGDVRSTFVYLIKKSKIRSGGVGLGLIKPHQTGVLVKVIESVSILKHLCSALQYIQI